MPEHHGSNARLSRSSAMKTSLTGRLPPFYTQVIGSLPRPGTVRVLLAKKYSLPARDYHAMDDMVRFAIRPQEVASLDVVSHGEWRRRYYLGEFLQRIGGFEKVRPYRHAGEAKLADGVVRGIRTALPVWNKDAEFPVRHTTRLSKFAPSSPLLIAIRYWHPDFSRDSYPVIQYLSRILRREADAENTLVVFTSDHGEGLGEYRSDRKYFRFEAAIKVPLVFAWPGCIIESVTERTTLASGIDLVSTLCAYAGVAPPPLTSVQNLRPALEGHVARNVRRFLPVEMSMRAVGRVVRSERSKYAVLAGEAVEQLFDLQLDRGETRNLVRKLSYEEIRREHRAALGECERRLQPARGAAGRGLFGAARAPSDGHRWEPKNF